MSWRKIILFAAVLVLLVGVWPVAAQGGPTPEEEELIAFVAATFEDFTDLETFAFDLEQEIEQTISATQAGTTVSLEQSILQVAEGQYRQGPRDTSEFSVTVDQDIDIRAPGQPRTQVSMTIDAVLLAGTLYMRFSNLPPQAQSLFPEGWVNVTEDGELPGMEMLNMGEITDLGGMLGLSQMGYVIDVDTVLEITELDTDTMDDQDMRVIQLELDSQTGFAGGAEALTSMFNTSIALDVDAFMEALFEGMTTSLTVWVGADDGFVHRADITIVIDTEIGAEITGNIPMQMEQSVAASTVYVGHGEEVEIEAPID